MNRERWRTLRDAAKAFLRWLLKVHREVDRGLAIKHGHFVEAERGRRRIGRCQRAAASVGSREGRPRRCKRKR